MNNVSLISLVTLTSVGPHAAPVRSSSVVTIGESNFELSMEFRKGTLDIYCTCRGILMMLRDGLVSIERSSNMTFLSIQHGKPLARRAFGPLSTLRNRGPAPDLEHRHSTHRHEVQSTVSLSYLLSVKIRPLQSFLDKLSRHSSSCGRFRNWALTAVAESGGISLESHRDHS